uniref:Uncharacterized protein n=1 Tax=Cacopsylla melanoneura TaxID=428564 RepID=A0A8D9EDF3_9HEMI
MTNQKQSTQQNYNQIKVENDELRIAIDALQTTVDGLKNQSQILNPHYCMSYDKLSYDSGDPESSSLCSAFNNSEGLAMDSMKSFAEELADYNKTNEVQNILELTDNQTDNSSINEQKNNDETNLEDTDEGEKNDEINEDSINNTIREITFRSGTKGARVMNNTNDISVSQIENRPSPKTHSTPNNITKHQTMRQKHLFDNTQVVPLAPEIQVYVPENLNTPYVRPKYINVNEMIETHGNSDVLTQIRIMDLEEHIRINSIRMKTIEEKIKDMTQKETSQKANVNAQIITKKKMCYMIGDSHLRYIQETMEKHTKLSETYTIQTHMKPGQGIEEIGKMHPQDLEEDSVLIVCAGTNDLYKTKLSTFEEQIKNLSNLKHRVIMISIPPQNCEYTNRDIVKINTRIKHFCSQFKNIEMLQTHTFIKPQHLARDGIHLGRRAKIWLGKKLAAMINDTNYETTQHENCITQIENNNNALNKQNVRYHQSWEESGIWENGRFIPNKEKDLTNEKVRYPGLYNKRGGYTQYNQRKFRRVNQDYQEEEEGLWENGEFIPLNTGKEKISNNENQTINLEWPDINGTKEQQPTCGQCNNPIKNVNGNPTQSKERNFRSSHKHPTRLIWKRI